MRSDLRITVAIELSVASTEIPTVQELAAAVGLSASRFSHLFVLQTGILPGSHLRLLRRLQKEQQKVGGSSIETSKIAGHANTKITEEYTVVQLRRQEELTRRIQGKRMKAVKRIKTKLVEIPSKGTAA